MCNVKIIQHRAESLYVHWRCADIFVAEVD